MLILAGPTATGKTAIGLEVCRRLNAEIVSVDARQLYRYMDIGTAKPSKAERARVHHHGLDIINPDQHCSAGEFARLARQAVGAIAGRGRIPLLIGGSGLYLQAIVDGLFADETPYGVVRRQLKERLATEGLPVLYEKLGRLDPAAHARLAPADTQRILRALEVALVNKQGIAEKWRHPQPQGELAPIFLALTRPRPVLYERIARRVDQMLAEGLVEEVEKLQGLGYGPTTPGMATMGYREMSGYILGQWDRPTAVARLVQETRRYAKRQMTWFRRDRRYRWIDVERWSPKGAVSRVMAHLDRYGCRID